MKTDNFVTIESGIHDFQMLAHRDYYAEITVSGSYRKEFEASRVMLRVACESDNSSVLPFFEPICGGGKWSAKLKLPAGGPYRLETGITIKESPESSEFLYRGDCVRHFSAGFVIMVAGQSNASGFGREQITDPPQYGVFSLGLNGVWGIASHPLNYLCSKQDSPSAEAVNCGHSPWLALAKKIYCHTGIPVGIVPVSLGGSCIDMWEKGKGILYENMLGILHNINGISFTVWYQGCSDCKPHFYKEYYEKFDRLIKNIKTDTGMPLYAVQINGAGYVDSNTKIYWETVREAQRLAAKANGVKLIPTYDLRPFSDDIHNTSYANMVIAERMFALFKDNGAKFPDIEKVCVSGGKIILYIENCTNLTVRKSQKGYMIKVKDSKGANLEIKEIVCRRGVIEIYAENIEKAKKVCLEADSFSDFAVCDEKTRFPLAAFCINI